MQHSPLLECLLNLNFSWVGSVTYLSFWRRLRRPGVRSPDHDIHLASLWPVTGTGIFDKRLPSFGLAYKRI